MSRRYRSLAPRLLCRILGCRPVCRPGGWGTYVYCARDGYPIGRTYTDGRWEE